MLQAFSSRDLQFLVAAVEWIKAISLLQNLIGIHSSLKQKQFKKQIFILFEIV